MRNKLSIAIFTTSIARDADICCYAIMHHYDCVPMGDIHNCEAVQVFRVVYGSCT